jgi:hypothetical protein
LLDALRDELQMLDVIRLAFDDAPKTYRLTSGIHNRQSKASYT